MTYPEITQLLPNCKQPVALYVVATPIGNLQDITLRALTTLKNVDLIACEDTRMTRRLLDAYDIHTKTYGYNDFSGEKEREYLIEQLAGGKSIALVSDAGTPLISDPGYKLTRAVKQAGYKLITIPGPCAAIAALSCSTLPSDQFYFVGFLPSKQEARKHSLQSLKHIYTTFIFYESANRLVDSLANIQEILGDCQAAVGRELTKLHEEVVQYPISELITYYQTHPCKGECVVLVSNAERPTMSSDSVNEMIIESLKSLSAKDTAAAIADITGIPKKEIYQRVLNLKSNHEK